MNNTWVQQIANAPKIKKYSQAGEEGYIKYILQTIPAPMGKDGEGFLVDIGASDGFSNSNTRYFLENYGYKGILIDGDNKGNPAIKQEWVTKENVVEILKKYNCPTEFDLLSLDLDGNDYDITYEILHHFRPRLVVLEINGTIPLGIAKKIRYNAEHSYKGDDYYGFSFSAAFTLAAHNGYRVVFQNDALNVYLVRADLLPDPDMKIEVPFTYHPYHAHNPDGIWDEVADPES